MYENVHFECNISVIIIIKINQMNSKRLKKWYTRHYEAFKNDQRDP